MAAPEAPDEPLSNLAPSIRDVRLVPKAPRIGDSIEAQVETDDPDSGSVRLLFTWLVNGRPVPNETRRAFSTKGLHKGDRVEVRVVASDGRLESKPRTARVKVGNQPPILQGVAFGSAEALAGDAIEAGPIASDPDGDPLSFRYRWFVNGKPTSQSERRFDSTDLARGDRVQAEVVASDGTAVTRPVRSLEVTIGNGAPRILGIPTPSETETEGEFRYVFAAEDPDGDKELRFRLKKAPRGMRIDARTGEARWKPDFDQAGVHAVEVVVEDAFGAGSALGFEVSVNVDDVPAAAAQR